MSFSGDFDGIENVEVPSQRAGYITPGLWVLEVQRLERITSKMKRGVRYFIATFVVVEGPEGIGQERAWVLKLDDPTIYLREIKAFVSTLLDADTIVTGDVVEGLLSADQPAARCRIRCEAREAMSKAGRPFTRLTWHPFTGNQ